MPHITTKQMNQNTDTLTQQDSEVVIHQNSNEKNRSIARHRRALMVMDGWGQHRPRGRRRDSVKGSRFRGSRIFRANGRPWGGGEDTAARRHTALCFLAGYPVHLLYQLCSHCWAHSGVKGCSYHDDSAFVMESNCDPLYLVGCGWENCM